MNPLVVLAQNRPIDTGDPNRPAGRPHLCFGCQKDYDQLIERGKLKKFPCDCSLSADIQMEEARPFTDDLSPEEKLTFEYAVDPVAWAEFEFGWKARWYQEELLRCLKWDQKVLMADGTIKNIADVQVGDLVLAYDEDHHSFPACRVSAVYDNGLREVFRICLDNGNKIEVTSDHPILSHLKDESINPLHACKSYKTVYKSIDDGLGVGSRVYTVNRFGSCGRLCASSKAKIVSIEPIGRHRVYDITVDTRHNFVANGVIVHNCSARKRIVRAARRLGKTSALSIKALHEATTHADYPVLVVAPFQHQVDLIFDQIDKHLENAMTVGSMVVGRKRGPQQVKFSNGSFILGMTAGVKSGDEASRIRGSDARSLYIDEADQLGKKDLEAILALLSGHEDVLLWISGTPTGKRELFWLWATDPSFNFKSFHYTWHVSPYYTDERDEWYRRTYSSAGYTHEFLAEFGEEEAGVFPKPLIDEQMLDYSLARRLPQVGFTYIMGIDWNDTSNGVHIVIVSHNEGDGKFWVEKHEVVSKEGFTQTAAVRKIVELNNIWKPSFIYADEGYGSCVGPNTLIQTRTGCREIKDIERGDQVLTASGEYREVLAKVVAEPKVSYRIRPRKCLETTVSSCHPFLTYRTRNRFHDKDIDERLLKWRVCPEIDPVRDFVAIPKTKERPCRVEHLVVDVVSYLQGKPGLEYDDKYVWFKTGYLPDQPVTNEVLAAQAGCSIPTIARARRKLRLGLDPTVGEQKAISILDTKYGASWRTPEVQKVQRFFDLASQDFQLVAGWFLSEGNANHSSVEISQKKPEFMAEFEEMVRAARRIFPSCKVYPTNIGGLRLTINSRVISLLFSSLFGNLCQNKRIPKEMTTLDLGPLLRGLFLGDGRISTKGQTVQCAMTSFGLIFQVRQYLIDRGILPSLYRVPPRTQEHQEQLRIDIAGDTNLRRFEQLTGLRCPRGSGPRSFIETENYFLVPISTFEEIGTVSGLVDIEVDGDHSFCGNGVALHNTQVQLLHEHGVKYPETGLARKVKAIKMGSKIEINDPVEGKVFKDVKPLIVGLCRARLEEGRCVLPKEEYHQGEGVEGLVDQMMAFRIKRYSDTGRPVYDDKVLDHVLTAWMLAMFGFYVEYTDLIYGRPVTRIGMVQAKTGGEPDPLTQAMKDDPRINPGLGWTTVVLPKERAEEKRRQEGRGSGFLPRVVDVRGSSSNLSIIRAHRDEKERLTNEINRAGVIGFRRHVARRPVRRKSF